MSKKLKTAHICQHCRKAVSFKSQRYQFHRLLSLGLSRPQANGVLPRCDPCVNKFFASGQIVMPQIALAKAKRPVVLVQVVPDSWPILYTEITNQEASFVCVRSSEKLLVATTALLQGIKPHSRAAIASTIEKAIIARPENAFPRFLASKDWGGSL